MGSELTVRTKGAEEAAGKSFSSAARERVGPSIPAQLSRAVVQAKLAVGPVDDPFEREADSVADRVVRRLRNGAPSDEANADGHDIEPAPANVSRVARSAHPRPVAPAPISRIMRSANASVASGATGGELEPEIESRIQRSSGGGEGLDAATRGQFESAMGADFGNVKVHKDSSLAPEIGAHAFTHGNDVHFAPGAFDPDTTGGQHLIAHELTHVVQQSGTAQRVQAKLWDSKTFKQRTAIGSRMGFSNASTAQDVILALLADYDKFLRKGFSSADPSMAAQAVSKIRAMQDVAQRWIKNRGEIYEDSTNFTLASLGQAQATYAAAEAGDEAPGPEAIASNPKDERMRGLQAFIKLCDSEIALMSTSLSDEALAGVAIDTTNKQYKKAVKRYPDSEDATSLFSKIGELAEMVAAAPGSASELTVEGSIPIQPGVFVIITVGGAVAKGTDGMVKLRGDIKVGVKGSIGGAAELSASLGGYLEAKGRSGAEAATLMSYALYRRGREGSAPTDLVSMLWGGTSGTSGLARSEAWSRQLETQVFGSDDPSASKAYVEGGGQAAVGLSVGDQDTLGGELAGGASAGRRVDKQSLMERKGGAGAQNVRSDSVLNAGQRQKRVGQETVGWSFGGKIAGGGFSAAIKVSRSGRQTGGGAKGGAKSTVWGDIEVEVQGAGPMPASLDLGAKIWQLAEKVVRKSEAAAAKQEDADAAGAKALLTGLGKMSPKLFQPKVDLTPGASITVTITISGSDWSVAIGTKQVNKLPLPEVLKVELKRTQTFVEVSSKGGAVTTWFLGQ